MFRRSGLIFTALLATATTPVDAFLLPRAADDASSPRVSIPLALVGSSVYSASVHMGTPPQLFTFQVASTTGYTLIAGPGCTTCSSNASAPLYNPSNSSSYVPPSTTQQPIGTSINGQALTGSLITENCGLHQGNGTWWLYPKQPILLASGGSSSSALQGGSGVLGLGTSAVQSPTDSFLAQHMAQNPSLTNMSISVALNSPNPATDSSPSVVVSGSNVGGSGAMDGSVANGGTIHIFQPNPQFFTPPMAVVPVADASSQAQFGATPSQLGSFDWTVQTEGWAFSSGSGKKANTTQGGNGTFATLEMAYPYILLTLADATKIFSIVKGAQEYNISSTATTSYGASVYQDPDAVSWSVPCSTVAQMSISFTFQGVTIPVQSNALYTNVGSDCVSNIKGWADPNRTTYILGSTFMSSAYITYTAFPNSAQTNQIGFANRQFASKSSSNTGAIVGGVIGGIALLLFVGLGAFIFGRQRGRTEAPSSTYLSIVGTPLEDKVGSMFRWLDRKKDYNDDNAEAEPWIAGTATGGVSPDDDIRSVEHAYGGNHNVVVMPWAPSAAEEEAFLSPTGRSFDHHGDVLDGDPLRQYSQTSLTMTTIETPPAPSPDRFAAGEYDQRHLYDPRGQDVMTHGGYSSVPTSGLSGQTSTGPVMWVERTGR